LNRGSPSAREPAAYQNDQREAIKEEILVKQLDKAGYDVVTADGLDRRSNRCNKNRDSVVVEKGPYKGKEFGIPMFAVYYRGKEDKDGNTIEDKWEKEYNDELLSTLDALFKAAHQRAWKKNDNVRGNAEYHKFDIDIADTSTMLDDVTWQQADYKLSDKATADIVVKQYEPVPKNKDGEDSEDRFLNSFVVTFFEQNKYVESLFSPHPTTGAYSVFALKHVGAPFHANNTDDEISKALNFLNDECDISNADPANVKIIVTRLIVGIEAGILDAEFQDALAKFTVEGLDIHSNPHVIKMPEVEKFRSLTNNLKKRKKSGQTKITEHLSKKGKMVSVTPEDLNGKNEDEDADDTEDGAAI
jgi:hypothetical protein